MRGTAMSGFMGIPMCLLVFGPESAPASIIATPVHGLRFFSLFCRDRRRNRSAEGATGFWPDRWQDGRVAAEQPVADCAGGRPCGRVERTSKLPAPLESFTHAARRRGLAGRTGLHRTVPCAGARGQPRRQVDRPSWSALKLILQPAVTAFFWLSKSFRCHRLWSHSAVILSAPADRVGPFSTIAKLYGLRGRRHVGPRFLASHIFAVLTVSLLVAWLAPT